ncbi:alpha-D-ribose 1-methylphosphonate 5-triphosphate diphosphatase [Oleispirillum naphthae]|uniref:alpha-D-ribose 1-methylphosphonate 5-triphosphate diphosphatase n=1 Tax=Oleispirillum naphthae TaxID=2838853 RepID=UPI0030824F98
MTSMILTNARIVTADAVIDGTVEVENGLIRSISEGRSALPSAIDLEGDHLLPGLVEMHTDNMEKNLEPRPGVKWPSPMAAVLAHDAQIAAAGITTVLDAISIGEAHKPGRDSFIDDSIAGVVRGLEADVLRADHKLHLRCEVVGATVVDLVRPHMDNPLVRVISLMDHTPGQRQWRELTHWLQYHKAEHLPPEVVQERLDTLRAARERYGETHRREIVALAQRHGLIIATHDDTEPSHVDEAAREGAAISEFPTTREAAARAHELGLATVMGSPNVVRGSSHSGNVSARELARDGLLDGLSSDYVPVSLLHAAFLLWEDLGLSLPQAVAMVSGNTARMIGLTDRGSIAPGLRADMVRVRLLPRLPVVRQVWRTGKAVA